VQCSNDGPTDPTPQNSKGKLVVKSNPSGARIYLMGTDTGKNTPDSLSDLDAGVYDLFLHLEYYDTAFFSVNVIENLTTTREITLIDGLPFVDITLNYTISFGGDSLKFNWILNQDVLLDSIIIKRPITSLKDTTEKKVFSSQLFSYEDQSGNPITYYLPEPGSGMNFYQRIEDTTYFIDFYGRKAHASMTAFHLFFSQEL
jgi:hypothetical protein